MFPNARIVHARRDPRDVCFSIFATRFTHPTDYSFDLADVAFVYQQYSRLMAHWRETVPQMVFDVQYEQLVEHQEGRT